MNIERAHKETKAIWKWLSENSNPKLRINKNKINAGKATNIDIKKYKNLCPYCELKKPCCMCPIYVEYGKDCEKKGYWEWEEDCTKENARRFYNKIKKL